MIIKDVRTHLLSVPWTVPPKFSLHAERGNREIIVVEVESATGIVGQGHIQTLRGGMRIKLQIIKDYEVKG